MSEFLLELVFEDLPARMQTFAADKLKAYFEKAMAAKGLNTQNMAAYSTPRRLVVVAGNLPTFTQETGEMVIGPKDTAPANIVEAFEKSQRERNPNATVTFDWLEINGERKRQATISVEPLQTAEYLGSIINDAIASIPWPKSMRWGNNTVAFARPLHRINAVFDGKQIAGSLNLGAEVIVYGNQTVGHRFHAHQPIEIQNFEQYKRDLEAAYVLIDREARKDKILYQAKEICRQNNLIHTETDWPLEEIIGLVEWPHVLAGEIPPEFLELPEEVLILSMRTHQRYMVLRDKNNRLASTFLFAANVKPEDNGARIIAGNQRVLNARLSDAKFFWEQDLKTPLEDLLPKLEGIQFHPKLGTMGDKARRLEKLVTESFANTFRLSDTETLLAARAAKLCKADLVSQMVQEFPELQGIMGSYYFDKQTDSQNFTKDTIFGSAVLAIREHYKPQGLEDTLPQSENSIIGCVIALADKLDTLAGYFAANEKPTSSKDPFALRRAALGCIRILLSDEIYDVPPIFVNPPFNVPLPDLLAQALSVQPVNGGAGVFEDLYSFFLDRFKVYMKDQGFAYDTIEAVLSWNEQQKSESQHNSKPYCSLYVLCSKTFQLHQFRNVPEYASVIASYRRATNILAAEERKDGKIYDGVVLRETLSHPLEQSLFDKIASIPPSSSPSILGVALSNFVKLDKPLEGFFEGLIVNDDDAATRRNRLQLLAQVRHLFHSFADFSKLV